MERDREWKGIWEIKCGIPQGMIKYKKLNKGVCKKNKLSKGECKKSAYSKN
jgi:hypothetical protein